MARSPAEIQAEIQLNRRAIEAHLDALEARVSFARWAPYAIVGTAILTGLLLSRLPVVRIVRLAMRTMVAVLTAVKLAQSAQRIFQGRARGDHPPVRNAGLPLLPPPE